MHSANKLLFSWLFCLSASSACLVLQRMIKNVTTFSIFSAILLKTHKTIDMSNTNDKSKTIAVIGYPDMMNLHSSFGRTSDFTYTLAQKAPEYKFEDRLNTTFSSEDSKLYGAIIVVDVNGFVEQAVKSAIQSIRQLRLSNIVIFIDDKFKMEDDDLIELCEVEILDEFSGYFEPTRIIGSTDIATFEDSKELKDLLKVLKVIQ